MISLEKIAERFREILIDGYNRNCLKYKKGMSHVHVKLSPDAQKRLEEVKAEEAQQAAAS
ncbi:hypothetical protein [Hahella ganghwensis]|uniref:hypothetical protein n=1 Tax=Hahella ganghwensis TaxID=286420 RepID=UPI00036AD4B2|nr:hypothetical protein [Hahella ganghwensis]